jgi:hypothetical protein
MIEKLTKEQIAKFPAYVEEGLRIGLSTDLCDRKAAEEAAVRCYEIVGLEKPKHFIWTDSPLSCAIAQTMFIKDDQVLNQVGYQVWEQVGSQVCDQIRDQVGDQVWNQVRAVWDQVLDQVGAQVWAQVRDQVGVGAHVRAKVKEDQVWAQVGDQVYQVQAPVRDQVSEVLFQVVAQVGAQVRDQVLAQVWENQVRDQVYGCHDISWIIFYVFFLRECGVREAEKTLGLYELAKNCGWWAPYKNVCFLQEKPKEIHMKDKRLHNEAGPSVLYRDGFSVYSLNGIRVPEWVVTKDPDTITKEEIFGIEDVDIRREAIGKIGIHRIAKWGKIIDYNDHYKLIDLSLEDGKYTPYLQMKNPSIDAHHVEGVHPNCKTITQALAWRNGVEKYSPPKVLT